MAKKTKANVQFETAGSDKPEIGDSMVWDGRDFVRSNDKGLYISKGCVVTDVPHLVPAYTSHWFMAPKQLFSVPTNSWHNLGTMLDSWDSTTGEWTCPKSGHYYIDFGLVSGFGSESYGQFPTGFYNPANGGGSVHVGIFAPGMTAFGCCAANGITIIQPMYDLFLTTSVHAWIGEGNKVYFKILNHCGYTINNLGSPNGPVSHVKMNIRRL